jgi:hypothetical protein
VESQLGAGYCAITKRLLELRNSCQPTRPTTTRGNSQPIVAPFPRVLRPTGEIVPTPATCATGWHRGQRSLEGHGRCAVSLALAYDVEEVSRG